MSRRWHGTHKAGWVAAIRRGKHRAHFWTGVERRFLALTVVLALAMTAPVVVGASNIPSSPGSAVVADRDGSGTRVARPLATGESEDPSLASVAPREIQSEIPTNILTTQYRLHILKR